MHVDGDVNVTHCEADATSELLFCIDNANKEPHLIPASPIRQRNDKLQLSTRPLRSWIGHGLPLHVENRKRKTLALPECKGHSWKFGSAATIEFESEHLQVK